MSTKVPRPPRRRAADALRRWRESPRPGLWGWDGEPQGVNLLVTFCVFATFFGVERLVAAVTRDGIVPRLAALGLGLGALAVACASGAMAVLYLLKPVEPDEPPPQPTAGELRDAGLEPVGRMARDRAERRAWRARGQL